MQIKVGIGKRFYQSIEYYADDVLTHDDPDSDTIDTIAAIGLMNSSAIGRLLDVLANKELLTASEVGHILEGHPNSFVEFCEEENRTHGN